VFPIGMSGLTLGRPSNGVKGAYLLDWVHGGQVARQSCSKSK